jgi:hypothetical protein
MASLYWAMRSISFAVDGNADGESGDAVVSEGVLESVAHAARARAGRARATRRVTVSGLSMTWRPDWTASRSTVAGTRTMVPRMACDRYPETAEVIRTT